MNYSKAVFLINKDVRAVICSYEPNDKGEPVNKATFKSMDKTLKAGDLVVVPTNTRWRMTVVKVVELDVEIDFEGGDKIEWIIGKVDDAAYRSTVESEDRAIGMIKASERTKRQNDLRDQMLAHMQPDQMKVLPMSNAVEKPVGGDGGAGQ